MNKRNKRGTKWLLPYQQRSANATASTALSSTQIKPQTLKERHFQRSLDCMDPPPPHPTHSLLPSLSLSKKIITHNTYIWSMLRRTAPINPTRETKQVVSYEQYHFLFRKTKQKILQLLSFLCMFVIFDSLDIVRYCLHPKT